MNRISISVFSVSALVLFGSIAQGFAADLVISDEVVAVPAAASSVAGVVEVAGGGAWNSEDWGFPSEPPLGSREWSDVLLSGSARIAIPLASDLTLQLDAWAAGFWGEFDCEGDCVASHYDFSAHSAGAAAHLAYRLDGASIGGFVSIGTTGYSDDFTDDPNGWIAAGLEGAASMGSFRAYGQLGAAKAISGYASDGEQLDIFASGVLAYYIDPDLRISGNAGVSRWTEEIFGSEELALTWGARIEKKFEDMPFSLFVAYQGKAWDATDDNTFGWDGSGHTVRIGARFAFGEGTGTLQDLDASVGLRDMNPIYGDAPN